MEQRFKAASCSSNSTRLHPRAARSTADGPHPFLAGRRVAVCDDEGIIQMHLRRLLQQAGMQVVGSAYNGVQAVELVHTTRPDVLLMDVQMPRMDGIDAAREILRTRSLPIVFVTASSTAEHQRRMQELGPTTLVTKPLHAPDLLRALANVLGTENR